MHLTEAVEQFLQHRTLKGCTDETIANYTRWLRDWQTWRTTRFPDGDLHAIGIDQFRLFLLYLRQEHIPHQNNPCRPAAATVGMDAASIQSYYRVLRAFWRFCAQEGWLTVAQGDYFVNERIPPAKVTPMIRATYSEQAFARLLAACDRGHPEARYRDQFILHVLRDTGIPGCGLPNFVVSGMSI